MDSFFQQVFTILTSDTGSLTYHLVLAFSIVAALLAAVIQWRGPNLQRGRRMVIGLGLLLLFRLALFLAAGLAWQGILSADILLPPVDRAVTLLGLVVILWLWSFPEPRRTADTGAVLLLLLTVTFTVLGIVWWSAQEAGQAFNGSWPDYVSEIFALALITLGGLLLIFRRPVGWGFGVGMLVLLMAGHLVYFLSGTTAGSFAGSVRLAQMAAYPILLLLPMRFPVPVGAVKVEQAAVPAELPSADGDSAALESLLDSVLETDTEKACQGIPRAAALALQGDLCLLVSVPDDSGKIIVRCGYDLVRKVRIPQTSIDGQMLPLLREALQRGRTMRLPGNSSASDLVFLAAALGVERSGSLLAAPVGASGDQSAAGLILLSPFSDRTWTLEDEDNLLLFSQRMARFLQHHDQVAALQEKLALAERALLEIKGRDEQSREEAQQLLDQIQNFQQSADLDRLQKESVAALLASLEDQQETINSLRSENQTLNERLNEAGDGSPAEVQRSEQINAGQSDQTTSSEPSITSEQFEVIASIAQELRQPMSSIVGYTDFLLGESVGILGALQRKFLERVRVSTERMGRLVDDLVHVTSMESGSGKLTPQAVDLSGVIDEAIAQTSGQLREKSISLRVDLPEHLPRLNADRDALQQILVHLLQNAGSATPAEGNIFMRGRIESSDGQLDYVLLQIADEGGGIPSDELPRVFSRIYHASSALIPGVGDSGVGLSIVKTLAEALGGRVWVDSEMGNGATFSVLLPVAPASSSNSNGGSGGVQA